MNRPGTNIPYSEAAIQSLREGFTKGLPCGVLSFADRAEERRFQKEVNRQAHEAASRMHAAIPTAHKDGRTDGPGRVERRKEDAVRQPVKRQALPVPYRREGSETLCLNYYVAQDAGDSRHAVEIMQSLGIKYTGAVPRPIVDDWMFYDCTFVPENLPLYILRVADDRPLEPVGKSPANPAKRTARKRQRAARKR